MEPAGVAVITGGGTGIGLAITEALIESRYTTVITGRRGDVLESACRALREKHPHATVAGISADIAVPEEATGLIDRIVAERGRVDALIANAGIYDAAPLLEMSVAQWDATLNINLRGAMLCGVAAARQMRENHSGRIVLISSISATIATVGGANYCAAKAAVESLARSMAVEFAEYGIIVNAVAPGWIDAGMMEETVASTPPEFFRRIIPAGRPGQPTEIANVVRYLIHDAPPFLNGTTLTVDGAQTAVGPLPEGFLELASRQKRP
jgi:NAD(P)-dependent dehydrogenase (short-subunit alcohol dehydrogenase family)